MATISFGSTLGTFARPVVAVRQGIAGAVALLLLWQRRADERLWLGQMDDHMLKDIGLSRADVSRETDKPFWKG